MSTLPVILISGDDDLYLDLSERLPVGKCRVVFCETRSATIDRAADADVVVVDDYIDGGGEVLCQDLRADYFTAAVPIVLRSRANRESMYADYVLRPNFDQTVTVIEYFCPDLTSETEEAEKAEAFNLGESTTHWRRQDDDETWPPPAPKRTDDQDQVSFAQSMAGYVNSLLEAFETPEGLTEAQSLRLLQMSTLVVADTEVVLNNVQKAINDALMAQNLDQMRALSSVKNALFETLRKLKSVLNDSPLASKLAATAPKAAPKKEKAEPQTAKKPLKPATGETEAVEEETEDEEDLAPKIRPLAQSTELAAADLSDTEKSHLTRAAERRERQRKRDTQIANRAIRASMMTEPAARPIRRLSRVTPRPTEKKSRASLIILLIGIIVIGGGTGGYIYLSKQSKATKRLNARNKPPKMISVDLQESPSGITARARAKDFEGDRVRYKVRWLVNGKVVPRALSLRLRRANYSKGSEIVVEITPADPFGSGPPMRSRPYKSLGTRALRTIQKATKPVAPRAAPAAPRRPRRRAPPRKKKRR